MGHPPPATAAAPAEADVVPVVDVAPASAKTSRFYRESSVEPPNNNVSITVK